MLVLHQKKFIGIFKFAKNTYMTLSISYICIFVHIYLDKDSIDNKRRFFMAKEKHVEGEADHYIKTLIGAVLVWICFYYHLF